MKSEKMSLLAKDCARDKDDFYFICDELNMIIKTIHAFLENRIKDK